MKRSLLSVVGSVLAIFLMSAMSVHASPTQWTVGELANDHWYEFVVPTDNEGLPTLITWEDAQAAAAEGDGFLATITSPEENDFIVDMILPAQTGIVAAWLGGFQPPEAAEPADGWEWVAGDEAVWSFTHWWEGEPNNLGNEDYLSMKLDPVQRGYWNDEDSPQGAYIVEYVPEPATLFLLALGGLVVPRRRH